MTELIEIHPLKTGKPRRSSKRSKAVQIVQTSSDSSSDDSSSDDQSPYVLQLPSKSSKTSKRTNTIQTLPIIINTKSATKKKKRHRKPVQQFLINTQPPPPPPPASPQKKEVIIQQMIEPSLPPAIQYIPISAGTPPMMNLVERDPFTYQRFYTPNVVQQHPFDFYNSYDIPDRRFMRVYPSNTKNVHLPRHARRIVNRFLNEMEHAHGYRYNDGHDSDCSIDDCRVCRRLRSAMNERRRRSNSEIDLYHNSRVLFDTQGAHTHKHGHSRNCKVCNLLQKSDIVISQTSDHAKPRKKKRGKHVHVVESYQSNIKPVVETITTTTTAKQPKTVTSVPTQAPHYPTSYTTYVDPNTGLAYAYDPNWQYDPTGANAAYDYSSYYNNPTHIQSLPQYETSNTTIPAAVDSSNLTTQQQHNKTTTLVSSNPLRDKGTYTYMSTDRKKRRPSNQTVVVHTSRNATPPAPKIYIEQPRPSRLPEKIQSTTIIKERTSRAPRVASTTYYNA